MFAHVCGAIGARHNGGLTISQVRSLHEIGKLTLTKLHLENEQSGFKMPGGFARPRQSVAAARDSPVPPPLPPPPPRPPPASSRPPLPPPATVAVDDSKVAVDHEQRRPDRGGQQRQTRWGVCLDEECRDRGATRAARRQAASAASQGVASGKMHITMHGCTCLSRTRGRNDDQEFTGCAAGWCDVEPGCAGALEVDYDRDYGGWDRCDRGASL